MKLTIGNVTLENNVFLAPMAGVTDLPFRLLCKEQGCGMMCTEMVSAKAILYNNKNTDKLLEVDPRERPVAVQLFGSDPEILSRMAARIEDCLLYTSQPRCVWVELRAEPEGGVIASNVRRAPILGVYPTMERAVDVYKRQCLWRP